MRRDSARGALSRSVCSVGRLLGVGCVQRSGCAQVNGTINLTGRTRPEVGWIRVKPQNQLGRPLRDGARDPIAEVERYLTAFFSAAPAVNFGTRVAWM